jgi:medium-chain acyl-[acyl-carrier-protein] hydrolase
MEIPYSTVKPVYDWHTRIATYDVGADQRLRLSNQLRLQQEVGERHLGEVGLGFQGLAEQNMAFLLTRLQTEILRAPEMGEEITLRSWHRANRGAQFFRCYQFWSAAGELLIEGVTAFALVDMQTHRLLRPSAFDRFGIQAQPRDTICCADPTRFALPENMQEAGTWQVGWSQTDWNGHLNNSVYADLLCDFLPGGMSGRQFRRVSLHFAGEARLGETLRLFHAERDGALYVCAEHDRGRCFEARAEMA